MPILKLFIFQVANNLLSTTFDKLIPSFIPNIDSENPEDEEELIRIIFGSIPNGKIDMKFISSQKNDQIEEKNQFKDVMKHCVFVYFWE